MSTPTLDAVAILYTYKIMVQDVKKRPAFLMAVKNMKVQNQRVGINKIAEMLKEAAAWLNLKDPHTHTSHAGRITATTFLANQGASNVQMKVAGGWANMKTVNGYIADSNLMRQDTAGKMLILAGAGQKRDEIKPMAGTFSSGDPPSLVQQKPSFMPAKRKATQESSGAVRLMPMPGTSSSEGGPSVVQQIPNQNQTATTAK